MAKAEANGNAKAKATVDLAHRLVTRFSKLLIRRF